jgi:hypothetical protein
MKRNELKAKLDELQVPKYLYNLGGKLTEDGLTMIFEKGKWSIYYTERGKKLLVQTSETEESACEFIYSHLRKEGHIK